MRVSLNELYRLCQKAAEGAGAPAGLDVETAQATVWLLARDFPVLPSLVTTLENLRPQACRFDPSALGTQTLDVSAKAGPLIASNLIGLLFSRSEQGFTLHDLSSPLYLLPSAIHCVTEQQITIKLYSAQDETWVIEVQPAKVQPAEILIYGAIDRLMELRAARVTKLYKGATDLAGLTITIDQTRLNQIQARTLAEGISIDPDIWRRLQMLGQQVLVPSSQASRQGAGAAASDND